MKYLNYPVERSVVIVTGGTRGIGKEIVKQLAEEGYAILFTHSNSDQDARNLEIELAGLGSKCRALRIDVSSDQAASKIFEAAETLGVVTGLVNNAGITGPLGKLSKLTDSALQSVIAVNLSAPIRLCREAAQRWAGRDFRSTIINISSVAARSGSPDEYVAYAATKGAIETLSIGLAKELACHGIYVNAVSPGTIDTTIHARAGEPDRAQRVADRVPLRRPGESHEVAQAVVWLISNEASYITGTVLCVAGGL
ncbi:SDR family oxidoreductase [Paralcaligenes sp. KSB-10]|uniref:SDR family NAD(P)-dependent oxidoreductase n=1 Tax=Paralcaligenes sp. KSB-10 TaxID=2901142 RepID=UPI001E3787E0|nr:SDR family oxidoreductase [Paralcaligenes sp. KSB-10]UHL64254.1 SDR family oxidoreductase [Paralcaligenes sp. KSB-10]